VTESSRPSQAYLDNGAEPATSGSPSTAAASGGREMGALDLMVLFATYKRTLGGVILLAALFAIVVAMLLPDMYTATTSIVPPSQEQSAARVLVGQLATSSGFSATDLGLANPGDLYIAMLKSASVQDAMVDQFDLKRIYSVKTYADARRKLDHRSEFLLDKEGLISISVRDHNPKGAAQLANGYVAQLRQLSQSLARSEAEQRRVFYDEKLAAERESLSAAEGSLKDAQQKTGLVLPDAQGQAIIDAVTSTRAQLAMAEVKLEEMRTFATPDNPSLKRAEVEVSGLRRQLEHLEHNPEVSGDGNLDIPARRLPEAELESIRLTRNLKYHESLYDFLSRQAEAARIDEAKQGAILQIVDEANIPERRSSPHRTSIVLFTVAVAFLLGCLSILARESVRRNEYTAARVEVLWRLLKWNP